MAPLFPRFEAVEWIYDGLKGKIIPWTRENGGTSDDPSVLCFVVGLDGKVIEKCPDDVSRQPKAFAAWLKKQADAWDRDHPRTRIPFRPAGAEVRGEGKTREVFCAALDEAVAGKKPVLLYFARETADETDRKQKAETAECRKFEKGTLGSAKAADEAEGWLLLRFDVAGEAGRLAAAKYGVEEVPALVAVVPAEEKPVLMDGKTTAGSLAYLLKKHTTAR